VYVTGLVLSKGWQVNARRYANIIGGYFLMVNRASKKSSYCELHIKKEQNRLHFMMLVLALVDCRRENIKLDAKFLLELISSLGGNRWQRWIIDSTLKLPRIVAVYVWMIHRMLRKVRNSIFRTSSIIRF
jgi:hypothetical protein